MMSATFPVTVGRPAAAGSCWAANRSVKDFALRVLTGYDGDSRSRCWTGCGAIRSVPPHQYGTGRSACDHLPGSYSGYTRLFGREDVDCASGPASPVLCWWGRSVGGLGPGLTSESADAARAVLGNDLSAGPQVNGTHRRCRSDLPGLGKRPGFTGPGGQRVRAIPQPEKGTAMTIVETPAITGGVDTHADVHVAAALDPI